MRPALLIIDMISAFDFPEAPAMRTELVRVARQISRLRAAFHRHELPVIFANDNFADWRRDFSGLVAMATVASDLGREITALLAPQAQDYHVLKPKHSAFLATPLTVLLAKLGADTLYLTGMAADSCVLATAMDANAREYRVRVVREAVAGLPARRRRALSLIAESKAGMVVTMRSAIAALP